MPHKPSPAKRRRDALRREQWRQRHQAYIRKNGELINVKQDSKFFLEAEVIEASGGRFLSPSHPKWTLSQLAYEYYRKKEQDQKSMLDRLREQEP